MGTDYPIHEEGKPMNHTRLAYAIALDLVVAAIILTVLL